MRAPGGLGQLLLHPLLLACVALLIANDHVLKPRFPSPLTGKLSDFAGLAFFPVLVALFLRVLGWRGIADGPLLLVAAVVSALGFILVKATEAGTGFATALLERTLPWPSALVTDPTDLLALPMVLAPWLVHGAARGHPAPRWLVVAAVSAASLASVATSRPGPMYRLERELENDQHSRVECRHRRGEVVIEGGTGVLTEWCEQLGRKGSRRLQGRWVEWYPGETVPHIEANYERGRLEGNWVERHPSGRPRQAGLYHDGKRTGLWRTWSETGELTLAECLTQGLPDPARDPARECY